ncbi:MAG: hypothetical protein ACJAR2_001754 [Ilumatobacter sp.]|jgi:hypothetical protein
MWFIRTGSTSSVVVVVLDVVVLDVVVLDVVVLADAVVEETETGPASSTFSSPPHEAATSNAAQTTIGRIAVPTRGQGPVQDLISPPVPVLRQRLCLDVRASNHATTRVFFAYAEPRIDAV